MSDEILDLLLSRVTDRTATTRDWKTLDCRAAGRPEVWARLADLLRDDAAVRGVAVRAAERAACIVPELTAPPRRFAIPRTIVAASIVLVVCGAFALGRTSADTSVEGVGSAAPLTSEEAFTIYVRQGVAEQSVLGELPPVVVTARKIGDESSVEVISVRRVLERRITRGLMQVVHDELGRPRSAPAELASFIPTESF